MQPQDIRLGLSHYQNIANAMDKSVEAQNMITQSFDKLADNAMKFSDFFARRQEAQEQKAFREKAYNDEKAYREQRDAISDERYTQEFDENKRRYDSDLALRNKVANAQVANYNANTRATNLNSDAATFYTGLNIQSILEQFGDNLHSTIGGKSIIASGSNFQQKHNSNNSYTQEKNKQKEQGISNPSVTALTKGTPKATNNNQPYISRIAQK
ncbi:Uncharacterised protein [Helicobacter cinaedi]|uniref:Uncharacterized protein n=1 Tax=Helicobacter cinaedi TaxID=213 RepID=A0A377JT37_9HELI|nr:hypothetical protein [Helicobacter cinaedi]STP11047.1 Uncharacterised protein [Helicobacter cinaedi]